MCGCSRVAMFSLFAGGYVQLVASGYLQLSTSGYVKLSTSGYMQLAANGYVRAVRAETRRARDRDPYLMDLTDWGAAASPVTSSLAAPRLEQRCIESVVIHRSNLQEIVFEVLRVYQHIPCFSSTFLICNNSEGNSLSQRSPSDWSANSATGYLFTVKIRVGVGTTGYARRYSSEVEHYAVVPLALIWTVGGKRWPTLPWPAVALPFLTHPLKARTSTQPQL